MYEFLTLYIAVPHDDLETKLYDAVDGCFFYINGKLDIFLSSDPKNSFSKHHFDSLNFKIC